jgi:hypothetical protein
MKITNVIDWWNLNRDKIKSILWILPKRWRVPVMTAIDLLDFFIGGSTGIMKMSLDTREVLPCIRTNADGSTTLINCKTGVEIPKKD